MSTGRFSVSSAAGQGEINGGRHVDETFQRRIEFALERLQQEHVPHGVAAKRLSVRVDPGPLAAAQARTGLTTPSELVTAALALLAAVDGHGAWLVAQRQRSLESFELPL